jgi:hypothetical protein
MTYDGRERSFGVAVFPHAVQRPRMSGAGYRARSVPWLDAIMSVDPVPSRFSVALDLSDAGSCPERAHLAC